uniref:6-phosphogluconolactonase n=1 Tax=Aestuariivirga sp. TaxID=2650926 RepID=UPI003784C0FB
MIAEERIFGSRGELADALARDVEADLARALAARGTALLAVSGGSTPALFFERLSRAPIDWRKVRVTLVDERQVPETSDRSNARLVRQHLLRHE